MFSFLSTNEIKKPGMIIGIASHIPNGNQRHNRDFTGIFFHTPCIMIVLRNAFSPMRYIIFPNIFLAGLTPTSVKKSRPREIFAICFVDIFPKRAI